MSGKLIPRVELVKFVKESLKIKGNTKGMVTRDSEKTCKMSRIHDKNRSYLYWLENIGLHDREEVGLQDDNPPTWANEMKEDTAQLKREMLETQPDSEKHREREWKICGDFDRFWKSLIQCIILGIAWIMKSHLLSMLIWGHWTMMHWSTKKWTCFKSPRRIVGKDWVAMASLFLIRRIVLWGNGVLTWWGPMGQIC